MDRKISDLTKKLKEGEFLLDEDTTEFALRNNSLSSVSTIERIAYNLQVLDLGYNILVDISPLASLTMLQKVNLEYNQITNLAPLKSLKLLQSINVKCNKLGMIMGPDGDSAMNGSLGALLGLKYLNEVWLEGNMPMCTDSMWLFTAFHLLGRSLDTISASSSDERLSSNVDVGVGNAGGLVIDGISQRELEVEVDVEATGEKAKGNQLMIIGQPQSRELHDSRQCEERMAHWQREVRKNINLRMHFERNLTSEMAEHSRFLQEYRAKQGEYERTIMHLTEQAGRSESKCADLEGKMKGFIKTIFEGITTTTDCVMYQVQYTKLMNVLDSMLTRVSCAEERVGVATTLVNEKMHQLRNENALLEANKRFFELEKQQYRDGDDRNGHGVSSGYSDGSCSDNDSGSGGGDGDGSRKLSHLLIPAVVESLFKALYKKLCSYQGDHRHSDTMQFGLVHCGDLYTILQHTPTIRTLLVSNLGSRRYKACLAQLAQIARCNDIEIDCGEGDACGMDLGVSNDNSTDAEVNMCVGENGYLTYGEMLLLLIPSVATDRRTGGPGFSHSELKELQRKKLYNDDLFSMIPLQIADARHPSNNSNSSSSVGRARVPDVSVESPREYNADWHGNKELSRLKRERAFLLERVQAQCRQFDRRAEGIRAHFEGLLKEKDVQLQHLGSSLADANGTSRELTRRLAECEGIVQDLRTASTKAKAEADKKQTRLMEQLDKLQTGTVTKGLYSELTQVNMNLERELECLRSETFKLKRDQLASARDLGRLQSEKDAVEASAVAISQQLEVVRGQLRGSQNEEERLRVELEEKSRVLEEHTRDQGTRDQQLKELQASVLEGQQQEAALQEENSALKQQLKELKAEQKSAQAKADARVVAAAEETLRQRSRSPPARYSDAENVAPAGQPSPTRSSETVAVATFSPNSPDAGMPLSSSYLINRIHMLQAKLDKGIVD